jgi:hypothetical protein
MPLPSVEVSSVLPGVRTASGFAAPLTGFTSRSVFEAEK